MIRNIIKRVLSKTTLPNISIMYSILLNWKEIAGDFFFNHSVPYKFFVKGSELYLACDDPDISLEVYFNQSILKERIKEKLNISVKVIKSVYNLEKFIRYRRFLSEEGPELPRIVIPNRKRKKIEKLVSKVGDSELREAIKIFLETSSFLEELKKEKKS
ncbi:MAG: DciA family protein [Brevinematia bacterium]